MLLVNHALSIIAHPRLRATEIMERFLTEGCFPSLFNKGNGFICAKQRKKAGMVAGGLDVAQWQEIAAKMCGVWGDASVLFWFPLLECGRIPG